MPEASQKLYTRPEFADKLLRIRVIEGSFVADPDWAALQRSPDVVVVTVGGTPDADDYTLQLVPMAGATYLGADVATPDPATYTADGGDANTDIATGLAAEITTLIGSEDAPGDLWIYYVSAVAVGANVFLTLRHDAPRHSLTLTAPAGATLVAAANDEAYPIMSTQSPVRSHDAEQCAEVAVSFIPIDEDGDPIANDSGCTIDVEAIRLVERRSPYATPNAPDPSVGVTSSQLEEGFDLNDEFRLPLDGGRWTVRLAAITNPPTGLYAIEMRQRPVHT